MILRNQPPAKPANSEPARPKRKNKAAATGDATSWAKFQAQDYLGQGRLLGRFRGARGRPRPRPVAEAGHTNLNLVQSS
jgi:hypothetical protein